MLHAFRQPLSYVTLQVARERITILRSVGRDSALRERLKWPCSAIVNGDDGLTVVFMFKPKLGFRSSVPLPNIHKGIGVISEMEPEAVCSFSMIFSYPGYIVCSHWLVVSVLCFVGCVFCLSTMGAPFSTVSISLSVGSASVSKKADPCSIAANNKIINDIRRFYHEKK